MDRWGDDGRRIGDDVVVRGQCEGLQLTLR